MTRRMIVSAALAAAILAAPYGATGAAHACGFECREQLRDMEVTHRLQQFDQERQQRRFEEEMFTTQQEIMQMQQKQLGENRWTSRSLSHCKAP